MLCGCVCVEPLSLSLLSPTVLACSLHNLGISLHGPFFVEGESYLVRTAVCVGQTDLLFCRWWLCVLTFDFSLGSQDHPVNRSRTLRIPYNDIVLEFSISGTNNNNQ